MILYGPISDESKDSDTPKRLVEISSFEGLCRKARKILHERSVTGTVEARQESIGFYESTIADPNVSSRVKIKARENLDKIQGVVAADPGILPMQPITGTITHRVLDIEKLGLSLEQKKKLLDDTRINDSSS
ncbi:MAG: hypothetical protein IIC84_07520 [Chloroflexi bacterium]|nr:hypothetical protein [Chloroflexota bacterium]